MANQSLKNKIIRSGVYENVRLIICRFANVSIYFKWMRGHTSMLGNEDEDTLAKEASKNGSLNQSYIGIHPFRLLFEAYAYQQALAKWKW